MPKKPGECDEVTSLANQVKAKNMVGSTRYALTDVYIAASDQAQGKVTVITGNKDGTSNTDVLPWNTFEAIWSPCPSTLPSSALPEDPGPPPPPGTSGRLYLADTFLAKRPDILTLTRPKWPTEFGADDQQYQDVKVWPTKIVIHGVQLEDGTNTEFTLDLLDPIRVKRGLTLTTDHCPITLSLTMEGCADIGIEFEPLQHLATAARVIESDGQRRPDALAAAWEIVSRSVVAYGKLQPDQRKDMVQVKDTLQRLLLDQSL